MFTKLGSLKLGDWGRGLLISIITAPLMIALQSFEAGSLVIDKRAIITAALAGGIAYLLKNLGTGSGGKVLSNK